MNVGRVRITAVLKTAQSVAVTRTPELGSRSFVRTLSIEQLEAGLRTLDSDDADLNCFWDENIAAFRQTVLLAIRETSDALLAPAISLEWRLEFEGQLEQLVKYLELADRYMRRRRCCNRVTVTRLQTPLRRHLRLSR